MTQADANRIACLAGALQRIADLKDEAYEVEPVSREVADIVARAAGRIARAALLEASGNVATDARSIAAAMQTQPRPSVSPDKEEVGE